MTTDSRHKGAEEHTVGFLTVGAVHPDDYDEDFFVANVNYMKAKSEIQRALVRLINDMNEWETEGDPLYVAEQAQCTLGIIRMQTDEFYALCSAKASQILRPGPGM